MQLKCLCGEVLSVEGAVGESRATCPSCGRVNSINLRGPQARDSLPVIAALLGVLMIFLALVWALMAPGLGAGSGGTASGGGGSGGTGEAGKVALGEDVSDAERGSGKQEVQMDPAEAKATQANDEEPVSDEAGSAGTPSEREPDPPDTRHVIDLSIASATGSASGTPSQSGSIFDQEGAGTKVVYVIDRSGSMSGALWRAATNELIKSLQGLTEDREFFVIFYDNDAEAMPSGKLLEATDGNKTRIVEWIRSIAPRGGTDPTQAMKQAIELGPDTIWLLTDGAFPESVAGVVRHANRNRNISINTIAFVERTGEPLLMRIARENNGEYRFVAGN